MSWDTGLFECFSDVKVLIVSWLCGTCQIAYQKAAIEEHECGIGDLIPVCIFPLCCALSVRQKIRQKYGFEGSFLGDLLAVWCCSLCAIAQQTRQLEMKGAKPAGMFMEK